MNKFCNDYVRIDSSGIDLMRNQFAYRHIDYSEITSVKIHNGHLLRNRLIPLIAGLFLVVFCLRLMIPVLEILKEILSDTPSHFDGRGFAMIFSMPGILVLIGIYFVVQSLRGSKILSVCTGKETCHIRIKEFEKRDELSDLIRFLRERMPGKVENERLYP